MTSRSPFQFNSFYNSLILQQSSGTPSSEYIVLHTKVPLYARVGYMQPTAVSNDVSARKEITLIHHFWCGPQPSSGVQLVVKPGKLVLLSLVFLVVL